MRWARWPNAGAGLAGALAAPAAAEVADAAGADGVPVRLQVKRPARSGVRPFGPADAAAVANLFWRTFPLRADRPPPAVEAYFAEIFLRHPWHDPDVPSRVCVDAEGKIVGFIGSLPVRMSRHGRPLRVAVASTIMADKESGDPFVGAKLLRSFLKGPQDLSITETANPVSLQMWLAAGGKALPLHSLEWVRVIKPVGMGTYFASRRVSPSLRFLRSPAAIADLLLARWLRGVRAVDRPRGGGDGRDVAPEDLAPIVSDAASGYSLRPEFDAPTLRWMIANAARKEGHGQPLARVVRGPSGRDIGGYLAHCRPGQILRVMQVFAPAASMRFILDDLVATAWRLGAVAVAGRSRPDMMDALQLERCVFRHLAFTIVHSRSADLVDAFARDDAMVNGLAGETWIRLFGDRFA